MSKTSHILSKQNSQQPKQFRGGEKKVMKKSLSLLVAIAMVFSMFATLVSADGKAAGQKLQDLGIIKGTSAGLDEDKEWLRQDVTVLLARLLGAESQAEAHANTHGFADLDSKFYNGYVSWAKEKGYFNGETDTRFGVGNPITNQQFAAVLLRVLNVDVEYAEAFDKAVELELVSADLDKAANAVRGNIYESLVTALDFKIDGKKLGNILGLKGYEITDLELVGASAVVSTAVSLEFNTDLKKVSNEDVTVVNSNGNSVLVEKVTIEGNKAQVSLAGNLVNGSSYTVTVNNAVSNEDNVLETASANFTYNAPVAASVSFKNTTVQVGSKLELVVKDANGNDVSSEFGINDFTITSSAPTVVVPGTLNTALPSGAGYISVVNATLNNNNTVTTGNVIITVKNALSVSIDTLKVAGTDNNTVYLAANGDSSTGTITRVVKDQAGNEILAPKVTYRSLNPSIVVVNNSEAAGATSQPFTALQAGTATIVVTAEYDGFTVSKNLVVTVKAAQSVASYDLSSTNISVVQGTTINNSVTVTAKDQYGQALSGVSVALTLPANTNVQLVTTSPVTTDGNGQAKFEFQAGADTGSVTATVSVQINNAAVTRTLTVNNVAQAAANGYLVEADGTTIDFNRHTTDTSKYLGETSRTITVYTKDVNGNKTGIVNTGVTVDPAVTSGSILTITGQSVTATAKGTETVNVKLNGVIVGTVTFTAAASNETLVDKVTQNKTSISIDKTATQAQLTAALFDKDNGALVGANIYGDARAVTPTAILSSNNSIVAASGATASLTGSTGSTVLTIQVGNSFYVVNVNVK